MSSLPSQPSQRQQQSLESATRDSSAATESAASNIDASPASSPSPDGVNVGTPSYWLRSLGASVGYQVNSSGATRSSNGGHMSLAAAGPMLSTVPSSAFGADSSGLSATIRRRQSANDPEEIDARAQNELEEIAARESALASFITPVEASPDPQLRQALEQSADLIIAHPEHGKYRGVTDDEKEPTVRFHMDVDEDESPNLAKQAVKEKRDALRSKLDRITDPDVREVLDPHSHRFLSDKEIFTWPREKIIELVRNFDVALVEGLFKKITASRAAAATLAAKEGRAPTDPNPVPESTSLSWRNLYFSSNDGTLLLQDCNGYVKPGQMAAVLGGPDAGVTTLLNVLAHQTKPSDGKLLGDIFINRRPSDRTFTRQVGYVRKSDNHLPQLTVAETLYFSSRLRTSSKDPKLDVLRVAITMQLLGLLHTFQTPVGDDVTRGVSGGEKRRVSVALELVAMHNLVICDLPTNGLDAGSALSLIAFCKSFTVLQKSFLCSLVQPSQAILDLFDMILVLSKGATLYFGPPMLVEQYFIDRGFHRPPAKPLPNWLEELSSAPEMFIKKFGLYRAIRERTQVSTKPVRPLQALLDKERHQRRVNAKRLLQATASMVAEEEDATIVVQHSPEPTMDPKLVDANLMQDTKPPSRFKAWKYLVECYTGSVFAHDVGYVLFNELTPQAVFRLNKREKRQLAAKKAHAKHGARKAASTSDGEEDELLDPSDATTMPFDSNTQSSAYVTSAWLQYFENTARLGTLFYRNRGIWVVNFIKSILIGLLLGTLFWDLSLTQPNVRTRFGLVYFCLTFNTANAQQLVPVLTSYRRVFQMQKDGGYYRPWTYYLALITVNFPIAIIESFLFILIVYPMSGLHGGLSSPRFGYAYLMLILINLVARSWVVLLTSITPTEALINILNGLSLVIFSVFSGYLNPKDSIPNGWIWAYYISYYTWALRGIMINELSGLVYDCTSASDCRYPTGEDALRLYGMDGPESDKWWCVLWMGLFFVGFNVIACWAMTVVSLQKQDREEEPDFVPLYNPSELVAPIGTTSVVAASTIPAQLQGGNTTNGGTNSPIPEETQPRDSPVPADQVVVEMTPLEKQSTAGASPDPAARAAIGSEMPCYISWKDLSYEIEIPGQKEPRVLLNSLRGYSAPGMIVALMGASGAGKTTLLDVLAGQKTGGRITGQLLVNNLPRDISFARVAGYAEQFDSHLESATVREAVHFAAMLRLPREITCDAAEVNSRVDHVLKALSLMRLQNDIIGGAATGGISQEARKKVTIAVELVADPHILFLDEPTTGLSSDAALAVMQSVMELSKSLAVICTIHQPSRELIGFFSHVCLLQPGGKLAYFGAFSKLANYFAGAGMPRMHAAENIADYAITCAKAKFDAAGNPVDLVKKFSESAEGKQLSDELERGVTPKNVQELWVERKAKLLHHGDACVAPFWLQFTELLVRHSRGLKRSPNLWFGRIFAQLLMGFIICTCFFQMDHGQTAVQNRISCLFMCVQFYMGSGALKLPAIFMERAIVFRERAAQTYTVEAYYLARWLHDWPLWAAETLIFTVLVYFVSNLNSSDSYARFGLLYLLLLETAQLGFSLSELIALASRTPATAYAFQGAVSTVCSLFSGFLISHANMPVGWAWAWYVTPYRYPLTASLQNEMRGQQFDCAITERTAGAATLCGITDTTFMRCPIQCGEEILTSTGIKIDGGDEAQNYGLILVYIAGFKILGYCAFKWIQHIRR